MHVGEDPEHFSDWLRPLASRTHPGRIQGFPARPAQTIFCELCVCVAGIFPYVHANLIDSLLQGLSEGAML